VIEKPLMTIQTRIAKSLLELVKGDITQQHVDAIVNAANTSLLGGGGVDGAIHRAAGPELLAYTRTLHGCKTGDAKISPAFRLPAKYVIHAVGPIYHEVAKRDPQASEQGRLLASCYRRSLELAVEHGARSIAFPAISTGVYRFPLTAAAAISLAEVCRFLMTEPPIDLVRFVLFDDNAFLHYKNMLEAYVRGQDFPLELVQL
jgi:O-acetyl-ADP-ribose deacetylase